MKIRKISASAECTETIAVMAKKMWTNHTVEELADGFAKAVKDPDSAVFILTDDNKAIGFAQCGLRHDYVEGTESSPVGYLEGIFVEKPYRKQGYAGQLLGQCEKWAKEKGCSEFASDCKIDNEISRQFHLGAGFREVNRIICFTKKL